MPQLITTRDIVFLLNLTIFSIFAAFSKIYSVFDTNACPAANGRKFGHRAENSWKISNKIGPDGRQYFGNQT